MFLLVFPATLMVVVLLVLPMLGLFRTSLNLYSPQELMVQALSGENYLDALGDPYYQRILLTTIGVALLCMVLSLALSLAPAYWLARMRSRWKSLVMILTLFPLLVGNVVRAAGWMALFGTDGAINAFWRSLGGETLQMMYTPFAVVVATTAVVLPYMILTLASVVEAVPRQTEEAAINLGASPLRMFFRVLLPQAAPGVLAGCVLVFILSMNAYATPVLLGGPGFTMLAPAVYEQFVSAGNWPFGAALAFVLLSATLILTLVVSLFLTRSLKRRTR